MNSYFSHLRAKTVVKRTWLFAFCVCVSANTYSAEQFELSAEASLQVAEPGEFLIQMESANQAQEVGAYVDGEIGKGAVSISQIANSRLSLVNLPPEERGWVNLNEYLELLEQAPGVQQVQPNYIRRTGSVGTTFSDPEQPKQWYLDAMNAKKAWAVSSDASNITVAVIDDAVMIEHDDLKAALWVNSKEIPNNGVDDDNNHYVDDVHGWNFGNKNNDPSPISDCLQSVRNNKVVIQGHGSHVAGAIGAITGNDRGISGIAPRVKIMSLAVGRARKGCSLDSAGILEAVKYAVQNGANIINLSLSGAFHGSVAEQVYKEASDNNVLLVIAAGNDGLSNDIEDIPNGSQLTVVGVANGDTLVHLALGPAYPASYSRTVEGILSVANMTREPGSGSLALLENDLKDGLKTLIAHQAHYKNGEIKLAGWHPHRWKTGSSFGKRSVHIGTPGTDIYSTIPLKKNGRAVSAYGYKTGTSMASPITAGAAALVWASFPEMTNVQVKERLLASVVVNDRLKGKVSSVGQIDLYRALCGSMFAKVAAGCTGATSKGKPPVEPPQQENPPAAKPVKKTPSPPAPAKNDTPNDWLRGNDRENADGSEGAIEW